MPQKGSVFGDVLETFKQEGGKAVKETVKQLVSPLNLLEGLDPVNPAEVAQKSQEFKAKDKAKMANIRSGLAMQQELGPKPTEQPRVQQGAEMAEKGQTNKMGQMNNQGGQQLSASQTPKKKPIPALEQKRKDRAPAGAG